MITFLYGCRRLYSIFGQQIQAGADETARHFVQHTDDCVKRGHPRRNWEGFRQPSPTKEIIDLSHPHRELAGSAQDIQHRHTRWLDHKVFSSHLRPKQVMPTDERLSDDTNESPRIFHGFSDLATSLLEFGRSH